MTNHSIMALGTGYKRRDTVMTINMNSIGKRLKELRKSSGLTQTQIAEYLGVDQSLVTRFENGERAMTTSIIERLANLYCCPVNFILSGEECGTSMKFAFRTVSTNAQDLESLAAIHKIALNQMMMDHLSK